MDLKKELIEITQEYFNEELDYARLSTATKKYKVILNELCGENLNVENGRNDIALENGKALGTFWAGLCLDDLLRTRKFIRGIHKAIQSKFRNGEQLHILYAGTGPFATLLLPFMLRFSDQNIKYTLLEINPLSFKVLKRIISKLDLNEEDITFVNEDATKYKINAAIEPNIIISETMLNALAKEQQVSIFLNLMRQITGDSIFIPEKIELTIGLKQKGISLQDAQDKHYHKEDKIFTVSKEAFFPSHPSEKRTISEGEFPRKQTIIDAETLAKHDQIAILTKIQVFEDENILLFESGLTTPLIIQEVPDHPKESIIIDTQYKISSEPELTYKITKLSNA